MMIIKRNILLVLLSFKQKQDLSSHLDITLLTCVSYSIEVLGSLELIKSFEDEIIIKTKLFSVNGCVFLIDILIIHHISEKIISITEDKREKADYLEVEKSKRADKLDLKRTQRPTKHQSNIKVKV